MLPNQEVALVRPRIEKGIRRQFCFLIKSEIVTVGKSPTVMEIAVECYAGYRGEETPRRFSIGERPVQVARIIDRWVTPDYRCFRVEGDDGRVYVLGQNAASGKWELV